MALVVLVCWSRIIRSRASGNCCTCLALRSIYANITGLLGILVIGWTCGEDSWRRKVPLVAVVAVGIIVFTAFGCLLAQACGEESASWSRKYFWQEYFRTLRVALPLAAVFGLGAFVHGSLRGRVQMAEAKLHEKELAKSGRGSWRRRRGCVRWSRAFIRISCSTP